MEIAHLNEMSATELVDRIRRGDTSSVEVTRACLDRIAATDGQLQAWIHLDAAFALKQAEELDRIRDAGRALGALHGVPVGLKDIIDTRDLPTEFGSRSMAGRQPTEDATVVDRLREAGAVILGKTATTEFAFMPPAATTNPHDPSRTPGGSSSGSAAAVAAHQVPLALGSQTNGSVIRPASFCGVIGLKPSYGIISRRGVLRTSGALDHVGVFGRTLEDVALLVDALASYDPADEASLARPRPSLLEGARAQAPAAPTFAWFDLPFADQMDDASHAGFARVRADLGDRIEVLPSPDDFAGLIDVHRTIHEHEIWLELGSVVEATPDLVEPQFRAAAERGRDVAQADYEKALEALAVLRRSLADFMEGYDAVIAPASAGVAPPIEGGTGNPIFNTIWTSAGLPCVTLPVLTGEQGLPIGVQVIGGIEADDRLMRTAGWLLDTLRNTNGQD